MSGFVSVWAPCFGCKRLFGFNPVRVPVIIVNGEREPVCRDCVERANANRRKLGNPLIEPHPDAYEPIPEEELP